MNKNELNPNWVTGFSDGESSFLVSINKYNKSSTGWQIVPAFAIELKDKDIPLLLREHCLFFFFLYEIINMKNIKNNKTISLFENEDICIPHNKVKPIKIYNDSLLNKFNALEDNRGKSAVYRWLHNINNKSYVGSSKDLSHRLKYYYDINNLKRIVLTSNSRIYKAILDDGYESFTLEILGYCDKNIRFEREQHYMDLLKP